MDRISLREKIKTHTNSGEFRESGRDLDGRLARKVLLLVEGPFVRLPTTATSQEVRHACPGAQGDDPPG